MHLAGRQSWSSSCPSLHNGLGFRRGQRSAHSVAARNKRPWHARDNKGNRGLCARPATLCPAATFPRASTLSCRTYYVALRAWPPSATPCRSLCAPHPQPKPHAERAMHGQNTGQITNPSPERRGQRTTCSRHRRHRHRRRPPPSDYFPCHSSRGCWLVEKVDSGFSKCSLQAHLYH